LLIPISSPAVVARKRFSRRQLREFRKSRVIRWQGRQARSPVFVRRGACIVSRLTEPAQTSDAMTIGSGDGGLPVAAAGFNAAGGQPKGLALSLGQGYAC
jgi:hypothetical protein